jgi:hypothetical protein
MRRPMRAGVRLDLRRSLPENLRLMHTVGQIRHIFIYVEVDSRRRFIGIS